MPLPFATVFQFVNVCETVLLDDETVPPLALYVTVKLLPVGFAVVRVRFVP